MAEGQELVEMGAVRLPPVPRRTSGFPSTNKPVLKPPPPPERHKTPEEHNELPPMPPPRALNRNDAGDDADQAGSEHDLCSLESMESGSNGEAEGAGEPHEREPRLEGGHAGAGDAGVRGQGDEPMGSEEEGQLESADEGEGEGEGEEDGDDRRRRSVHWDDAIRGEHQHRDEGDQPRRDSMKVRRSSGSNVSLVGELAGMPVDARRAWRRLSNNSAGSDLQKDLEVLQQAKAKRKRASMARVARERQEHEASVHDSERRMSEQQVELVWKQQHDASKSLKQAVERHLPSRASLRNLTKRVSSAFSLKRKKDADSQDETALKTAALEQSFLLMLVVPDARVLFEEWLEANHALDNLRFVDKVEEFEQTQSTVTLRSLHQQFLQYRCETPISVSSTARGMLTKGIGKAMRDGALEPELYQGLRMAKQEVLGVLQHDHFPAFVASDQSVEWRGMCRRAAMDDPDGHDWNNPDLAALWAEETLLRLVMHENHDSGAAKDKEFLIVLSSLASVVFRRGKFEEATDLYTDLCVHCTERFGTRSVDTIRAQGNLVASLAAQGRIREASELAARVVRAKTAMYGAAHLSTLVARNNLAMLLREDGQLDEAESLLADVYALMAAMFGEAHPNSLNVLGNLWLVRCSKGQEEAAVSEIEHVVLLLRQFGELENRTALEKFAYELGLMNVGLKRVVSAQQHQQQHHPDQDAGPEPDQHPEFQHALLSPLAPPTPSQRGINHTPTINEKDFADLNIPASPGGSNNSRHSP